MLELDRSYLGFKTKTVYFADQPFDVEKVDWVQFNHIRKKLEIQGFERQEYINGILDLTRGTEQLWNEMHKDCRHQVKRSQREEVTININRNFEEFIKMNNEFRREKNLPPIFQHYLKPPLPDFCTLFTAEHNGEMIGGILLIKDDNEMYSLLSASKRLSVGKELTHLIGRANRRLRWEAMVWGSEQGLLVWDMGNFPVKGTEPEKEGVWEFKRLFGADAISSYVYRKLYSRKAKIVNAYRLMRAGKK